MFFKILMFSILFANITFGLNNIDSKEKYCLSITDSLNINSQYSITGKDGSQFEGILTAKDSIKITVKNISGKELSILWSQIKKINDSNGNTVYRAIEITETEDAESTQGYVKSSDSTDLCTIVLNSGNSLNNVRIINSDDSTFTVTKSNFNKTFKISGINSIEFEQHNFWKGFLYGTIGTLVFTEGLAAILSRSVHGEEGMGIAILALGGLIICTPVGVITGVISEFFSDKLSYDFNNINYYAKANRLKYLRGKHRN